MTTSVVIPLGGFDELLEPQLRAVLAQELESPFSVVLSVNTADPAACAAIDALVARVGDARVHVVSSADLRSASHARNVGLRAAPEDADLIAFCDSDDVVDPGWLAALIDALGEHAAVGGQLIDVYPDPRQASWRPPATPGELPTFLGVPYIVTANMIIRRDAFEAVGGFDTQLVRCEDIAISWALLKAGYTIGYAAAATVQYRHRPGLWLLLRQHELYGQGMAQVLARYGLPTGDQWEAPRGVAMLRPNGQRASRRSMVGTLRRVALGVGRVHGIVSERRAG
jgi:cellulose synthase/poly-beta-1,6-N-acetylglucosamine synthase-like glycosyltransferase